MKLRTIIPILLSMLIGIAFAYFMFSQYEEGEDLSNLLPTNQPVEKESVYFLQLGVYSSKESMETNTQNVSHYIYQEKDGKYHVYVGITKLEENVTRIKGLYEKKGYILYSKQLEVGNESFLSSLEEYDQLLQKTEEDAAIETIENNIIVQYKELVLDGQDEGTTEK